MIRKVVFPVAGLGTRLLPATKEVPKEILPIIDTPIIHYAVEEAAASGMEDFIFITAQGKESLENYFSPRPDLENVLARSGKRELLAGLEPYYGRNFLFIRQSQALGFGHAVSLAETAVAGEPFAISLPDDLIVADVPVIRQMAEIYRERRLPMIAFMKVPDSEVSRYGIAAGRSVGESLFEIESLVEKPRPNEALSNFAVIGRYIMPPEIFPLLKAGRRGAGGEIQLTDAVCELLKKQKVLGYFFSGQRFDLGTPAGYVEAILHFALKRPDTRPAILAAIRSIHESEGL